jgi:hypothetical protein
MLSRTFAGCVAFRGWRPWLSKAEKRFVGAIGAKIKRKQKWTSCHILLTIAEV